MCDLLAPLLVILDDGEWVALLHCPHTFVGVRGGICWAGGGPLQWEGPMLGGVEQLVAGSRLSLMLPDSQEPSLGTACTFCSVRCVSEASPCCAALALCVWSGKGYSCCEWMAGCGDTGADAAVSVQRSSNCLSSLHRGSGFQLFHGAYEEDESELPPRGSHGHPLCQHEISDPGRGFLAQGRQPLKPEGESCSWDGSLRGAERSFQRQEAGGRAGGCKESLGVTRARIAKEGEAGWKMVW